MLLKPYVDAQHVQQACRRGGKGEEGERQGRTVYVWVRLVATGWQRRQVHPQAM